MAAAFARKRLLIDVRKSNAALQRCESVCINKTDAATYRSPAGARSTNPNGGKRSPTAANAYGLRARRQRSTPNALSTRGQRGCNTRLEDCGCGQRLVASPDQVRRSTEGVPPTSGDNDQRDAFDRRPPEDRLRIPAAAACPHARSARRLLSPLARRALHRLHLQSLTCALPRR